MEMKYGITAFSILFLLAGCGSNQPSATSNSGNSTGINQAAAANSNQPNPAQSSKTSSSTKTGNEASSEKPVKSNEQPIAPEKNPVGDIPDSQAFVTYTSVKGGYSFTAPEGWSQTESGTDVNFVDKFDGVKTTVVTDTHPFTIDNIKNNEVQHLIANGRAVQIVETKEVTLPGGKAVEVKFNSNSNPNPVTNKQIRLENESFYFSKNGKVATLTLWAPLRADNVDQWKKMSESWRWK
jgi:hypothetical protein